TTRWKISITRRPIGRLRFCSRSAWWRWRRSTRRDTPAKPPAEAAVLEFAFQARRGSFHLQVECRFSSPWTVIFGPSGSGKSTIVRLLAGLDRARPATELARVILDGRALTDTANRAWAAPGRRQTALVTQQPALFPHLSVAANVAYGLAKLDRATRDERVREVLELAGATELAAYRPQHLSGGRAQR